MRLNAARYAVLLRKVSAAVPGDDENNEGCKEEMVRRVRKNQNFVCCFYGAAYCAALVQNSLRSGRE